MIPCGLKLVGEMRRYFGQLAAEGRLKGLFFYTWQGGVHAANEDQRSAVRCGALTASGRQALAPIKSN